MWRQRFKQFCCYQDSELLQQIMNQFNDYHLQECFQAILVHQFLQGYLISSEYQVLYANKIIEHNVPISADLFGEMFYLRCDEKDQNYLHPSDLYSVVVPRLWKEVFYNDIFMYDKGKIANFSAHVVHNSLLRDPACKATTAVQLTETSANSSVEQEGLDKRPP